jgi:hypothetical protein
MSAPIRIPTFQPNTIKPNDAILVCGPRSSGKSTLIRDLVHTLTSISPCAAGFAITLRDDRERPNFISSTSIYQADSLDSMLSLLKDMTTLGLDDTKKYVIGVYDDLAAKPSLSSEGPAVSCITFYETQKNFNFINSTFDAVAILGPLPPLHKEHLYSQYQGSLSSEEFCAVLDKAGKDHQAIIVKENGIYWYKARDWLPAFSLPSLKKEPTRQKEETTQTPYDIVFE